MTLVGYEWNGTITNSYATGSLIGNQSDGGLVGVNYGGIITNNYATESVSGSGGNVGGLVGFSWGGTITTSYALGSVTGSGGYVGGLVGDNYGGTIIGSSVSGSSVIGSSYVGGLVGHNNGGTISGSSVIGGSVSGSSSYVGGLVGYGKGGTINGSSVLGGSVSGSSYIGGLLGTNSLGTINGSSVSGCSVSGNGAVGGLVGTNSGIISGSYATGSLTGNLSVGGLVGVNYHGTITNSYATGSVTDNGDYVGGLVGYNYYATITNSYATGRVTGSGVNVGGLVGGNPGGTITNSFWDTTTSGQPTSSGGTGITTADMMKLSTFSSWNTSTPNTISKTGGSGAVWRIYEGHTAPLLTSFLKPLSLANVSKVYNKASQTGTINGALSGQAATGINVGNYSNSYYSNQQGYDITGGNLIIKPKALTMSGLAVAASKVYDGTTKAVVTGTKTLAVPEAVGQGSATDGKSYIGDSMSLTGTAVGTYNFKNVATASKVTYSGLSLTGNQPGNYTLTIQSPASAKITPKTVTLKATKKYDGLTILKAGTVTIGTGVMVNGKTESLGYSGATAYSSNIADNKINYIKAITLLNGTSGELASNYALPTLNHVNAPVTIQ